MTDPAPLAPNENRAQLQRLQAQDLTPALQRWMGEPEALVRGSTPIYPRPANGVPGSCPAAQVGALRSRVNTF